VKLLESQFTQGTNGKGPVAIDRYSSIYNMSVPSI
jgi:hypothetical protein